MLLRTEQLDLQAEIPKDGAGALLVHGASARSCSPSNLDGNEEYLLLSYYSSMDVSKKPLNNG
jgi:hypothetical protein